MVQDLLSRIPTHYNRYIEPFFGGGALFFNLQPAGSIIADVNPELINLYSCIAQKPEPVIRLLKTFQNTEDFFYKIRSMDRSELDLYFAAARTIYLNKTCFNGLYRVNKSGQFNVPYGRYTNPTICDEQNLLLASALLKKTTIVCGDYKSVLQEYAQKGDFIFLDPPYLPISAYSDFKRYTKEQFYEEDHHELAEEIERLRKLGCAVLLTNSNHPLVHKLFANYKIEVIQTKRYINSDASKRKGEDVMVTIPPALPAMKATLPVLPDQLNLYPSTRWMGSKSKLLPHLQRVASQIDFHSVLDLFSGSGIVSYMFKAMGKEVVCNDYMALSALYAKAMVENSKVRLPVEEARRLLVAPKGGTDRFVETTFDGLYFSREENVLIDVLRTNIRRLRNEFKKAIALAALTRACTKKRPRGIFTYVGHRYDDGRKDLQLSLEEQFLNAVAEISAAVFDNGQVNHARKGDAMDIRRHADLVYMDPPYFSPLSDNEYVRRYHFVEGLACDWKDLVIQEHTKTKKFKSYPTPFSSRKGAYDAFDRLFHKFKDSKLLVSYSSNSLPTLDEITGLLSNYKAQVEVVKVDYKYSFGNQQENISSNSAQEYIFIAQ